MVAQALFLPETSRSAAFNLWSKYEKLLYTHEQEHTFNRDLNYSLFMIQAFSTSFTAS